MGFKFLSFFSHAEATIMLWIYDFIDYDFMMILKNSNGVVHIESVDNGLKI